MNPPMLRDFPPIQLSPPPGEPTQEEIARMKAEIDAEYIARGELPGCGGYNNQRPRWSPVLPGIRECHYSGPGAAEWRR